MAKRGKQKLSFSSERDYSGLSHGSSYQSADLDYSRASTFTQRSDYTYRSTQSDRSKASTSSFKRAAKSFTGAFSSCFVPHGNKVKGDDQVQRIEEDFDVSVNSSSQKSTTSSRNIKLNRLSSDSQNGRWQQQNQFTFGEIYRATSNFSPENVIGQGGFGTVYKGKLRDGSLIAVKRAKKNLYDKQLSAEFRSEIDTLSKVEHLNLVKFLGYIEHDDERLIVVELVSNGSLRQHLDSSRGDTLEILQRLNIATDIAHAIAYLHGYADHPIIHRDIKASNILLTETLRAKVADFGFARLAPDDPEATHVSTQVKGTAGYVDPEYLRTYQLTEKSDVFSFGVLLVELITGRRPIERGRDQRERITTTWAIKKYKEGDAVIAMDARIRRSPAAVSAVERIMRLAEECVAPTRQSRPSMRKCAEDLWAIRRDYQQQQQQKKVQDSVASNNNTRSSLRDSFPGIREE